MVLAERHLARAHQHAGGGDAAYLADFQRDAGARDERAGRGEHGMQAGARVGGTAYHVDLLAGAGIHAAHAQPVRVRMLHRFDDAGGAERSERSRAVGDAFDLQADAGQSRGQTIERRVRIQMVAQPGERELHAPTPSCRVAGLNGELP